MSFGQVPLNVAVTECVRPLVRREAHGDVAVVTLANHPVNALSNGLRRALQAEFKAALEDPSVCAIVMRGEGRVFCAGADIREFGKVREQPWTAALAAQLDAGGKPVVAAIHGVALGGGLELALGAHYRVASCSAKLGLPEVRLGLIPGGGGTQRLPRLVGAAIAAQMVAAGEALDAVSAYGCGLVDQVVDGGEEVHAAIELAQSLVRSGAAMRRTRDASALKDKAASLAQLENVRSRLQARIDGSLAPTLALQAIARAIEGAFDEGIEFELRAFMLCLESPEREALVRAFFAQRRGADGSSAPEEHNRR